MPLDWRLIAAAALLSSLFGCMEPGRIAGRARGVDGDSFRIGATDIRLHAIDAPEVRQTCRREGQTWPCGDAAARKLAELVRDREVTCEQRDIDNYGRIVAQCSNGSVDLGAAMVSAGLALAYRRYGDDYVAQEDDARTAQLGLWAGEFTPPWDWRRTGERSATAPTQAAGNSQCSIKGNVNRRGERIYHVPGSASYSRTVVDEAAGERWFCTIDEAQRAGWRAPRASR